MGTLEFRQMLIAAAIALAVMAATHAPRSRPLSIEPVLDGARTLLRFDLCPGGGFLSCALER
jgi:hypothetical protein